MSGSYVLDTNVLLHLIRGNALGSKINQAFELTSNMRRHVVSIVTQAELWVIADRRNWGDAKRAALQHALDNLVIVPIEGTRIIQAYVSICQADLKAIGGARNLKINDIWIAATALYTGLPLLTTDKDFQFLDGNSLQVLWVDPLSP